MICLLDYIGIKTCEGQTAPGGGWINSLPGISLQSIDAIANEDQITYVGLWNDITTEAMVRFESDFMNELDRCYNLNPYTDYGAIICNNLKRLTSAWRYLLGNQLMIFRLYSSRLNRFTTIDVKQAGELRDYYQVQYESALTQAAKLVNLGDNELDCSGDPAVVVWLP
ncbi:MAG: hypothetical protein H0X33_14090 [Taibaiella sp.]|nr:hypothetical protein [Taibaiella sp.]